MLNKSRNGNGSIIKVQAQVPDAILTAIGKNPPAGLTGSGIETTGYVVDLMPLNFVYSVF